jgi:PEP-CTERM/exosortase A-associated glycosyltransferase
VPDLLSLASRARLMARNAPLAASVAVRRLSVDPTDTAVRLAERLPTSLLRRAGASSEARLLLAEDDATAEALVEGLAPTGGGAAAAGAPGLGTTRRLIAIATAQNRTDLATSLLESLPAQDAARPRLSARLEWKRGLLTQARDEVAPGRTSSGRDARLHAALDDELAVLQVPTAPAEARRAPLYSPAPHRVLHLVTNSLPYSNAGYTTRTHQILTAQKQIGLDPHALTRLGFPVAQGAFGAPSLDIVDGIPYHRSLPARPLPRRAVARFAYEIDEAADIVATLRPGVLHAASNHWNGQVALALRDRFGVPVVYEVRGFLEESWLSRRDGEETDGSSTDRYRLERDLETFVMREADLVTTLGEVMRQEIVSRGIDPERVILAPNAVDDRFLTTAPDARDLRRTLGIADDEITVGVISTLYKHEGIVTLVDAVARLAPSNPRLRLVVVGDGPERDAIRARAEQAGIADRTLLTGRVPFNRVHDYYAAIDVFCVPRVQARVSDLVTPLKPVEAMATARAMVASDVGGLREVITDGVTGVLVRPDDAVALAEGIEPLLYDLDLRSRLGVAARDWVAEHRTWTQVASRYRDAYAQLGAE